MKKSEFTSFLRTLKAEDWSKMATSKWTVKDVVAHLTGWERDDIAAIKKSWETKEVPWWDKTDEYDEYNRKWVDFYASYSPHELVTELEKWQGEVQETIQSIGEDELKKFPHIFGWLFDESDKSHYAVHYKQIESALV